MKKLKDKFKKYGTKKNAIIAGVGIVILGGILHLGGLTYLKEVFSSRAGGVAALDGEEEKDITKFQNPNQCVTLYPWGPPLIKDKEVNDRSLFICRNAYAIQYDPKIRVPLWEVEILKNTNVVPFNIPSSLGPSLDPDLPKKMQASLNDYIQSGYNFGYLAPTENMYINNESLLENQLEQLNKQSLKESFYMTNAYPEGKAATLIKKQIDLQTRALIKQKSPLFLVSGVVYLSGQTNGVIGTGENKTYIPTHLYKIITFPNSYGSIAYLIPNKNELNCGHVCTPEDFIVSIKEVERVTGIEFYSKLSPFYAVQVKQDINELFKEKKK